MSGAINSFSPLQQLEAHVADACALIDLLAQRLAAIDEMERTKTGSTCAVGILNLAARVQTNLTRTCDACFADHGRLP